MGLREQIKSAKTESEIDSLLQTGAKYQYASASTRSSWKSTARKTLISLKNTEDSASEPINQQDQKKQKVKKTKTSK